MIIHFEQTAYYNWEPVPDGTQVTQSDINRKLVKPSINGGWLMRVERELDTNTQIAMSEGVIYNKIISLELKGIGNKSRPQLVAEYIEEMILPHHAHKKHLVNFIVNDDGPKPDELRMVLSKALDDHKNRVFSDEHVDEMVANYVADKDVNMAEFLNKFFGLGK